MSDETIISSHFAGKNAGNNIAMFRESIGAGDIVTLKSGGPKMVVSERTADKAHCVWHFDNGDSCWQWFPIVVLQVSK